MQIKVVKDKISLAEVKKLAEESYGDMVKAVADIGQGILAIGGEMHADADTHYQPKALKKYLMMNNKLQELSLVMLRFDNNDIYNDLNGVMDKIYEVVNDLSNSF